MEIGKIDLEQFQKNSMMSFFELAQMRHMSIERFNPYDNLNAIFISRFKAIPNTTNTGRIDCVEAFKCVFEIYEKAIEGGTYLLGRWSNPLDQLGQGERVSNHRTN